MGFGGQPMDIEQLIPLGRDGGVDFLLNYPDIPNKRMEKILRKRFGATTVIFSLGIMQNWWFTRMALTTRQFEEKMTLFWHNHFATEYNVAPTFVLNQNVTQRENALARFDTLVLKTAQDPAMLVYLDNVSNVKDQPNENYARELMELHTMGINDVVTGEPNYTQTDVEEVSRAFTGWTIQRGPGLSAVFAFDEDNHDFGQKEIFGLPPANLDGADVIDIICRRPATARFIAKKLFDYFAYPLGETDEDKATIEKFAAVYMQTDHSIREVVRAIFVSDEFFSQRARFALRKTPIEFTVGAVRMFGADLVINSLFSASGPDRSRRMGMSLFEPPNVAGWKPESWFSTANLLERFNYATHLATLRSSFSGPSEAVISPKQIAKNTAPTAEETVQNFLKLAGLLNVDNAVTDALATYLKSRNGQVGGFRPNAATQDKKVRSLIALIMMLPEFQLA
jgi:uncharacterized protein (DUF1800 family)